MRNDTKLARIRQAMRLGDWDAALRAAARFQRLGDQDAAIRRAVAAINNPSFYRQLGQDVERLRAEGIAALKARYTKSWDVVDSGKENPDEQDDD